MIKIIITAMAGTVVGILPMYLFTRRAIREERRARRRASDLVRQWNPIAHRTASEELRWAMQDHSRASIHLAKRMTIGFVVSVGLYVATLSLLKSMMP